MSFWSNSSLTYSIGAEKNWEAGVHRAWGSYILISLAFSKLFKYKLPEVQSDLYESQSAYNHFHFFKSAQLSTYKSQDTWQKTPQPVQPQ